MSSRGKKGPYTESPGRLKGSEINWDEITFDSFTIRQDKPVTRQSSQTRGPKKLDVVGFALKEEKDKEAQEPVASDSDAAAALREEAREILVKAQEMSARIEETDGRSQEKTADSSDETVFDVEQEPVSAQAPEQESDMESSAELTETYDAEETAAADDDRAEIEEEDEEDVEDEEESEGEQDSLEEEPDEDVDQPVSQSTAQDEDTKPAPVRKSARPVRKGSAAGVPVHRTAARRSASPYAQLGRSKSARPAQIRHVDYSYHDDYVAPLNKTKQPGRGMRVVKTLLGFGAIALVMLYAGMTYFYTDHFFRRTSINGVDVSDMTAYEAEQAIADHVNQYTIRVASRNNAPQVIRGSEIDYRYLSNGEVLGLLKKQKSWLWPFGILRGIRYKASENVTFDKSLLRSQLKALECAKAENQVAPQDAYVTMVGDEFMIVPESQGSELKVKEAYLALDEAVASSEESIDFSSDPEVYAQAVLTADSPQIHNMLDAYNNYARASITYTFGDEKVTLDGDTLKTWLDFDDKGELITDSGVFQQHIADWVAQLSAEHDTAGTSRPFQATDGRTVYVWGTAYGWLIDAEGEAAQLAQDISSGAEVTREPVYAMRANSFGYNDFGSTYIEVDMGNQHMYYYQNGEIIFDSDIVSGDITYEDRATPEGVYKLYFKQSPAVLRGAIQESTGKPEYETEVSFWMPFNGGIGFHDAEWQPYFGGDRYVGGGSHGCINLPYWAAQTLYDIIEYDVPIICFY